MSIKESVAMENASQPLTITENERGEMLPDFLLRIFYSVLTILRVLVATQTLDAF